MNKNKFNWINKYRKCVLATAENMVKEENKKYGYYDEFNAGKYKNDDGLALQFLRLLIIFKENRSDFELEYKHYDEAKHYNFIDEDTNKFVFPEKIDIAFVKDKIENWKTLTINENYRKYFQEIINIIQYKNTFDLEKEKKQYYTDIRNDEQKKENIENIIKIKGLKKKEDDKVTDDYVKNGGFKYEPNYNKPAGRWRK